MNGVVIDDRCNDRYPIVAERDELRQQLQAMLEAQQRIVDENASLTSRLEHVQGLYDALVTAQSSHHEPVLQEGEEDEVRVGRRPSLRIDLPVSSQPPAPVITLHSPGGSGILDKRVSFAMTASFSPSSSEASPRSPFPQQPQALRPPPRHPAAASGPKRKGERGGTDWLRSLVSPSRPRSTTYEVIVV